MLRQYSRIRSVAGTVVDFSPSRPVGFLLLVFLTQIVVITVAGWQEDVRPHTIVHLGKSQPCSDCSSEEGKSGGRASAKDSQKSAENEVKRFLGNKSHIDYFKLLERDGESLLVGARNIVYNISLHNLTENQRLEWYATEAHIGLCVMKGKSENDCQNYIRVLAKHNNRILVCGTNAYKPMCRYYYLEDGVYKFDKEMSGQGLCPYDPNHNSTAVFAGGELYVATVADFSATDPLIYREKLRTEQYDPKHLNAPNFVSSLSYGDFVFFFFRETAVEYINCGKTVYSRVGRVCMKDKGGPHKFANRWTSFLKARLNCSVGGDFPFYFNEIQSTSNIVEGVYGGKKTQLIYAVFTTPPNSISGSAVCAFRMEDILNTFKGPFREQETLNANWLPVQDSKVPEPQPGQCVNESQTLPDVTLNFIKGHTLMDQSVSAFWGHPIAIRTSLQYRFTQIAVDPQVKTPDGKTYDVLFIGTDNGKVLKAVNAESPNSDKTVNTVIIEEIQVFQENIAITNLRVYRNTESRSDEGHLIVVSNDEIQAIKLQRCYGEKITSCSECVALQDPYCAWDEKHQKCTSTGSPRWSAGEGFLQNVALGYHARCPDGMGPVYVSQSPIFSEIPHTTSATPALACPPCPYKCNCPQLPPLPPEVFNNSIPDEGQGPHASTTPQRSPQQNPSRPGRHNDLGNAIPTSLAETDEKGPQYGASRESPPIYTAETLAIAVATSIVAALVVGFISGYLFSRRCRSEEVDTPYSGDTYLEQRRSVPRLSHDPPPPPLMNHSDAFLSPTSNNKHINLVLNVPPKNGNGKNANSSADNKPVQKVLLYKGKPVLEPPANPDTTTC